MTTDSDLTGIDSLPDSLRTAVVGLCSECPKAVNVINDIMAYYKDRMDSGDSQSKKRKVASSELWQPTEPCIVTLQQIAFVSPRKKLDLKIFPTHITGYDTKADKYEFVCKITNIDSILALPTAAKQTPHTTFVFIEKPDSTTSCENIALFMFGIENKQAIKAQFGNENVQSISALDVPDLLMKQIPSIPISAASKAIFVSSLTKDLYVKAYLKTQETVAYFLKDGIFLGFKKPSYLFKVNNIVNTSISAVTSRTFNMTIELANEQTYELSMIDAGEYNSLMEYIQRVKKSWHMNATGQVAEPEKLAQADETPAEVTAVQENSEEDDDDFVAEDMDEPDEEYDSDYDSDKSAKDGPESSCDDNSDGDVNDVGSDQSDELLQNEEVDELNEDSC